MTNCRGREAESSFAPSIDFYLHTYFQLIVIKLTLRRVQISGSLGKHFACYSMCPPLDVNINSLTLAFWGPDASATKTNDDGCGYDMGK